MLASATIGRIKIHFSKKLCFVVMFMLYMKQEKNITLNKRVDSNVSLKMH